MTETRYLAVDPTTAGFAHVVFESPGRLVHWGLSSCRDDAAWIERLEDLIEAFVPDMIVAPEASGRLGERALRLLGHVESIALLKGIWMVSVPKKSVRRLFPEARSKHDVALSLVERFPELRPRLPRRRRSWQSEDSRMRIFDALSLILAASTPLPLIGSLSCHEDIQD